MKRALIVEDNPVWTGLFERYCRQEGIEPLSVMSPQSAMDVLDDVQPDVILVDMLLATETGMALLNEMRGYDDLSTIPVVLCSGVSGVTLEQVAPFGVSAVLDKATTTPEDVRYELRRLAYGGE